MSQPKALRSRARGYLSELRRGTCPEESYLFFCFPFLPHRIFRGCHKPLHSHWPKQSCLSHAKAPSSLWHFLLHIFNFSGSLHFFSSIWRTSIIHIHKMGKPLDFSTSFRHISLTSASQSFFKASFYRVCSSFWNLTPFFFPARLVS